MVKEGVFILEQFIMQLYHLQMSSLGFTFKGHFCVEKGKTLETGPKSENDPRTEVIKKKNQQPTDQQCSQD